MHHRLAIPYLLVLLLSSSAAAKTNGFPCYADVNDNTRPHSFQGFGTWEAQPDEAEITIHFDQQAQTNLPCTGETLDVTVPNGQLVKIVVSSDPAFGSCSTTASVASAPTEIPIAELLNIISKGPFKSQENAVPRIDKPPFHLKPLKNKTVTITTSCGDTNTPKYAQTIRITYQNPPRLAVSAGILIAPGVQSFAIKTTQTGIGSGGVVMTQNSLASNSAPTVQFIPFSFANLYYAGSRTLNLNAQLGLGVNPNLSSARVEFFASPLALSWHDLYLSPGFHVGQHERLTGGFRPGELTPGSLSKPPIGWSYFTGFGFSISYNLKPLVKSSATTAGK